MHNSTPRVSNSQQMKSLGCMQEYLLQSMQTCALCINGVHRSAYFEADTLPCRSGCDKSMSTVAQSFGAQRLCSMTQSKGSTSGSVVSSKPAHKALVIDTASRRPLYCLLFMMTVGSSTTRPAAPPMLSVPCASYSACGHHTGPGFLETQYTLQMLMPDRILSQC